MSNDLTASVGRAAVNRVDDVIAVQRLLTRRGFRIGTADGQCGRRTQTAIVTFQRSFMQAPDALVDVGGLTWRKLTAPPPDAAGEGLTRLVPTPPRATLNVGLQAVSNPFMQLRLGAPRADFSADCQPVTNARLRRNITRASVGPFNVQGLQPAVESLAAVLVDVRNLQPEAYNALGTAGMLCCRYVRGSTTSISNHSWGTAVDLTLGGVLDRRGNDMVQHGLSLIAPIFNRHGWYWGAAFRTEDAMHFEASRTLIEAWEPSIV